MGNELASNRNSVAMTREELSENIQSQLSNDTTTTTATINNNNDGYFGSRSDSASNNNNNHNNNHSNNNHHHHYHQHHLSSPASSISSPSSVNNNISKSPPPFSSHSSPSPSPSSTDIFPSLNQQQQQQTTASPLLSHSLPSPSSSSSLQMMKRMSTRSSKSTTTASDEPFEVIMLSRLRHMVRDQDLHSKIYDSSASTDTHSGGSNITQTNTTINNYTNDSSSSSSTSVTPRSLSSQVSSVGVGPHFPSAVQLSRKYSSVASSYLSPHDFSTAYANYSSGDSARFRSLSNALKVAPHATMSTRRYHSEEIFDDDDTTRDAYDDDEYTESLSNSEIIKSFGRQNSMNYLDEADLTSENSSPGLEKVKRSKPLLMRNPIKALRKHKVRLEQIQEEKKRNRMSKQLQKQREIAKQETEHALAVRQDEAQTIDYWVSYQRALSHIGRNNIRREIRRLDPQNKYLTSRIRRHYEFEMQHQSKKKTRFKFFTKRTKNSELEDKRSALEKSISDIRQAKDLCLIYGLDLECLAPLVPDSDIKKIRKELIAVPECPIDMFADQDNRAPIKRLILRWINSVLLHYESIPDLESFDIEWTVITVRHIYYAILNQYRIPYPLSELTLFKSEPETESEQHYIHEMAVLILSIELFKDMYIERRAYEKITEYSAYGVAYSSVQENTRHLNEATTIIQSIPRNSYNVTRLSVKVNLSIRGQSSIRTRVEISHIIKSMNGVELSQAMIRLHMNRSFPWGEQNTCRIQSAIRSSLDMCSRFTSLLSSTVISASTLSHVETKRTSSETYILQSMIRMFRTHRVNTQAILNNVLSNIRLAMIQKNIQKQLHDIMCVEGSFRKTLRSLDRHSKCVATSRSQALIRSKRSNSTCLFSIERVVSLQALCRTHSTICDKVLMSHGALLQQAVVRLYVTRVEQISLLCHVGSHQAVVRKNCRNSHLENDSKCLLLIESVLSCSLVSKKLLCLYHAQILICNSSQCGLITADTLIQNTLVMKIQATARKFELGKRPGIERCTNIQCCIYTANTPSLSTMFRGTLCIQSLIRSSLVDKIHDAQCKLELLTATKRRWGAQNLLHGTQFNLSPLHCIIRLSALKWKSQLVEKDVKCLQGVLTSWRTKANEREYYVYTLPASIKSCIQRSQVTDDRQLMINVNTVISQILTVRENNTKFQKCSVISAILRRMNYQLNLDNDLIMIQSIARSLNFKIYEDVEAIKSIIRTKLLTSYEDFAHNISKLSSLIRRELNTSLIPKVLVLQISLRSNLFSCNNLAIIRALITISSCFRTSLRRGEGSVGDYLYSTIRSSQVNPPFSQAVGTQSVCRSHSSMLAPDSVRVAQCTARMALDRRILSSSDRVLCDTSAMIVTRGHLLGAFNTVSLIQSNIRRSVNTKKTCVIIQNIVRMALLHTSKLSSPWDLQAVISSRCVSVLSPVSCSIVQSMTRGGDLKISFKPTIAIQALFSLQGYAKISTTALSAELFSFEKRQQATLKKLDIIKLQARSRSIQGIEDCHNGIRQVQATIRSLLLNASYGPIKLQQLAQITTIQSGVISSSENNFDTEALRCCISRTHGGRQLSECYQAIIILEAAARWSFQAKRCEKISITALSASSFSWEKRYPTARKNIDITKIQAISRAIRDNYEDFCRVKASIQTSLLLHVSYEVSIQSLLRQQLVRINHDHCIQLSAVTRSSLGRSKDILPIRVMQGHIRASQHHISPNQIAMIQSRIRPTLKNNFDTETLRCCISRTRDSMQFSGCYRVIAILEAAVRINLEAEGCETIYVTTLNALSLANERIQQATLKMKDIMKIQAIFRSLQAIQNTCKEIFRVQATIRTSQSLNNSHETVAIDRVSQTSIQSLLRQQLLRFNPDHCIQLSTIIRSSLGRSKDTLLINIMQGHIRSNQWNLSPNQIAMIQSEIRFTQRYDFDTRILRFCMLRAHGGIQLSEYCRAITILETATRRRLKAKEYEAIHDTVLNGCEKSQKTRSKTKGVMKIQAIFRSITGILDNYEGICRVQAMIRPFQLLDMPHRTNSINHIPIQSCLLQCVSRFNSEYCIQLSTVIRGSLGRCKDTLSINIVQDFLRSYEHHLSLNQIVTIQSGIRSAAENNFDTEAHGGIQLSEYCRAITILEAATRGCRKTGGYGAIHVTVLNAITRGREKRQKTNEIMKIQALSRAIQDSQDNYEDICRVQATMCTSQSLNFNALVVDRISQIPIQSFLRQQLAKFNLDSCVQLSAIVRGSLARNKDALFIKVMQGLTRASQYHSSSGQTAVIQSRIRSILKNNFDTENLRCCISRTHGGVHLSEYCRAIAILEATTLGGLKADSTTPLVTSVCHIQSIVRCAQVGISPVIAYTAKMSSYLRSSSLHDTNSDILVHIMQSIVRTNLNSPKLKYSNLACEIQTSLQSSDLCQMQLHGQCLQNFIKNRSTNDYYEELKLVQSVLKQRYVNPKNTQNTSRIQALVRRDVNYMRVELISSLEAHLRYVLSEGSNLAYGIIPHLQAVIKANVIKGDHLSREQNLGIMKASIRPSHPHNHDLKAISDIEAVMSAVNDRSSLALGIVKLAPLSSFRPNDMNSFTTQMQESLSVIHSLIQSRNVDIIEHGRLGHLQAQFLQSKGGYKQEQLSIDKLSSCFVDVDAVREKQMEMRVVQKLASTCRRVGRQANSALQVNYVRKIQSICRRLNNLLNTNHLTVQASMRSSTQDLLKIIAPLSATIESTMITQPRIDFLQSLIRNSLAEQFVGNQNIATMQNICRTHEQEARLSGLTQCIHSLLLSRVLTYPSLVRCIQSIILTRESIIDFKELHLLVHLASSTLSYPSPVTPYCITNAALQCTNRREMIDEVVCCQAITRMALVPHNRDRDSIRPTPESSFQLLSKQLIIEGITLLKKYICEATKVLGRHLWQRYTITGYANNCNMTWHRSVQASSLVYSLRFHQSASAERK